MLQSFHPREWFERDGDYPAETYPSERRPSMWVYRLIGDAYTVGYYTPDKFWVGDVEYSVTEYGHDKAHRMAAARCHWLNGGNNQ